MQSDNEFSAKLRRGIRAEPHIEVSMPKLIAVPGSGNVIYVFAIPQSARRPHLPSMADERFFWKRSNSTCERMTLEEIRYQMLSYDEKREKLILLVIDLEAKAARLKRLTSVPPGSTLGTTFSFDVVDRVVVGHCHVNELSPPSSSLSPDFGAGQQARSGFTDRAPPATDSCSIPGRLKLTMPARIRRRDQQRSGSVLGARINQLRQLFGGGLRVHQGG
jgi:hypothetical protein